MDEFEGEGIKYFEEVVNGRDCSDKRLDGKKAVNWYVSHTKLIPCNPSLNSMSLLRITHELLGQLAQRDVAWTADKFPSHLMHELLVMVEQGELTGMLRQQGLVPPRPAC